MLLDFAPAAVLFDMDGLMIDSESAVMACWREASAAKGVAIDEAVLFGMVGLHEKLCYALLTQHYPDLDVMDLMLATDALYGQRVSAGLPLKPGIVPLLEWLGTMNVRKAVATSTRRDRAAEKLSNTGLIQHFPLVVTGSDITHPKPNPEIYLQAAARLGVDPTQCVVLEDSEPGVRAALAAGMTPIQVPDMKAPSAELIALGHRIVPSLTDAHALLKQVFESTQQPS